MCNPEVRMYKTDPMCAHTCIYTLIGVYYTYICSVYIYVYTVQSISDVCTYIHTNRSLLCIHTYVVYTYVHYIHTLYVENMLNVCDMYCIKSLVYLLVLYCLNQRDPRHPITQSGPRHPITQSGPSYLIT